MSEVLPPLFLSTRGYEEAVRVFEAFQGERTEAVGKAVDMAAEHLVSRSWADYDQTYLSLYVLHLARHGEPLEVVARAVEEKALPHRETVRFHLAIDLAVGESRYAMLDERAVANLINFRHALEGLIPFRMHPHLLVLGLPWKRHGIVDPPDAFPERHMTLGFQVRQYRSRAMWGPAGDGVLVQFDVLYPELAGVRPLTGGARSEGAGDGLVSSFLQGAAWKAISARFNVDDVAVHGRA